MQNYYVYILCNLNLRSEKKEKCIETDIYFHLVLKKYL